MQRRAGTTLPLLQRSVSKCWHQGRTQCRVEAHWDISVRRNILPAGDRLYGLVRRAEGLSMARLRLWTDNSHEFVSQKVAEEKKNVTDILESLTPQHDIPGLPPLPVLSQGQ